LAGFPASFLFGTATSATQIEGGCATSDWATWPKVAGGDTPAVGCGSWERWREDVACLRELSQGSYRLSIEWARVEPSPGAWDHAALDAYREQIGALRDAGIEPMVTLHHFSLPLWLAARGGLCADELVPRMVAYTRQVARALGDLCRLWVTINEPNVGVANGYLLGIWPPGARAPGRALRAHQNLLRAHVAMYRALHELHPDAQVGLAHHLRVVTPERARHLGDRAGAFLLRAVWNDAFAAAVSDGWGAAGRLLPVAFARGTQDFFGLNYYSRDVVRLMWRPAELFLHRGVPPGAPRSDLGWEIHPPGLGRLLREWGARSGRPIYVTENGLADAGDSQRPRFIVDHLSEVSRAIADGVDVRGYYHWSLMDNFEWAEGYWPRFGLYEVDRRTLARRPRPSAHLYGEIARTRRLPVGV
jgi:beta-glucosidase